MICPEKEKKERGSKKKHGAYNHTHTFVNNSETNSITMIIFKIIINIMDVTVLTFKHCKNYFEITTV